MPINDDVFARTCTVSIANVGTSAIITRRRLLAKESEYLSRVKVIESGWRDVSVSLGVTVICEKC